MKKMKIAVLGTRGFPGVQGGVESHCEKLYPCLVDQGCEVTVFTRKGYVDSRLSEYKGVNLVQLACPRNRYLEALIHTFLGVLAAIRIKPDILHIHAIGPSFFVPLARLMGLKVVMTHHGPDYERLKWGSIAKAILRLGEMLGCLFANEVICISRFIADRVRSEYSREASVIPNGVDLPQVPNTYEALKKYKLLDKKYLLAVGRFVPEKGFDYLIKAFNELMSPHCQKNNRQLARDGWRLVIVGGADHEDEYSILLKKEAAQNERIVLTGILTGRPLYELYSHAGLFILPSYYEGMPIVLLEAMSYGLSCIASDIPANKNIGLPHVRYFRKGDIDGLGSKIVEFIAKPMTSDEARKQHDTVAENYNWDDIAAKTRAIYKKTCE